jgi:hypothetical protein
MRTLTLATMLVAGALAGPAVGGERPFTGAFEGTGRACSGNLYIREKTAEWNTPFSVCKPARYELLEKDFTGEHKRIALRIKSRSKRCAYEVFEVEQVSRYGWNANAYQTLEAFQKRAQPDWLGSPLPERLTLSCPTVLLD